MSKKLNLYKYVIYIYYIFVTMKNTYYKINEIKYFQYIIISEVYNHCGNDINTYDWILSLRAIPKFNKLYLTNNDSKIHIT